MKIKEKVTLNKSDYKENTMPKKGMISSLIVIGILALISLIFAFIYYRPTYNEDYLNINETFFIMVIAMIGVFTFLGVMLVIGSYKKRGKNKLLLLEKNKEKYKIVEELSIKPATNEESNVIEDDYEEAGINDSDSLVYVETQINKQDDINVSEVTSFTQFAELIDNYFLNKGYKTHVGKELVASIATYPVIILNKGEFNNVFCENINSCFNSPNLVIDAEKCETIENDYALFDAVNAARSFKNSPVFLVIDNLVASKAESYLKPLYKYIKNPNVGNIRLSENVINIPNNLNIVINLKSDSRIFDIGLSILKRSTVISFDCEADDSIVDKNPLAIELNHFTIPYSLTRLKNEIYLEEDCWKKIDAIEECFCNAGNEKFDNKLLSHLESYVSILLAISEDQMYSLDEVLANFVLYPCLLKAGQNVFKEDNDLISVFDNIFGEDDMVKSREVINSFKFNKEKEGNE